MEAAADYQYAPLRIPPGTSRSAAATMLSLQADTGGWELARLQLHADGTRKVILRRRARLSYLPLPGHLDVPAASRHGVDDTARGRDMGERPTLIQSVQRALRIIEVVAEHDGRARAKEVARATGLPLATTYHLLRTCAHEGWLQRLDDGSYVLGHRIDVVRSQGTAARGIAHARPALEWLRDELGGAVYLARYVDGEIVVAEIVDSARAPRIDLWVGMHDAAHATALGKCILGQLPALERQDYLPGIPCTTSPRAPWSTGAGCGCRPTGEIAVDDGEYAIGVCCLAATVTTGPRRGRGRRRHRASRGRPGADAADAAGRRGPGVPRPGPRVAVSRRHLKSGTLAGA